MHWSAGVGATEQGPRLDNQDSFLSDGPVQIVADGMGGHAGGGAASKAVVGAFAHLSTIETVRPSDVSSAVQAAQLAVDAVSSSIGSEAGSTLTGAVAVEHEGQPWWMVVNIGDSRVYLVERGEIDQITVDHSYVQELVDRGDITPAQARTHPERNIITRAVGDGRPYFDAWLVPVVPGQQLVIATDGLTNALPDALIASIVAAAEGTAQAVGHLVDAALAAGATDNVTVIVTESPDRKTAADAVATPWPRWPEDLFEDDEITLERTHPKRG